MAKRKAARERRKKRKQQDQRSRWVTIVVVVAVIAVLGIAALASGAGGVTFNERFELDPILGNPDAPVTIIEYGAYACPSCKFWHEQGIIEQILAEFPDQVRFIFRDFPVISPTYDRMAAALAQCVLDQGEDKFWAFHDLLYTVARQGVSSYDELISLAERAGANADEVRACGDAGTHRETVLYDNHRARELGLRGTPSFFVNDKQLYSLSVEALRAEVQAALN